MEKISWTDRVRNEVLHRVKEKRNTLCVRERKGNLIGHILRRKCLLEDVTKGKKEGGIEVRGKTRKKTRRAAG
jgi:hypothetical protein